VLSAEVLAPIAPSRPFSSGRYNPADRGPGDAIKGLAANTDEDASAIP
jgi:hypothetical protein